MSQNAGRPVVLCATAHPDDIEFMCAGTLLRLKEAGCEIHMWNISAGTCGTIAYSKEEIARIRWQESQASAKLAGATPHPAIADDFEIYYDAATVAKAASVVRLVNPDIVLTHSPQDYMEDHQNTCRLLVTGAFTRGMPNFTPNPPRPPVSKQVALYHAMPHGLRDGLRRLVRAGQFVDVGSVLKTKREMLACHKSQKEWLDVSQGMDSYLNEMEAMSRQVGKLSGKFEYAEGWRRHSHLGFGAADYDPLAKLLGKACFTDPQYEKDLGEAP